MYSPRTRNWVAFEDGTDSWSPTGTAGTPVKEYCYHCLNSKASNEVCGQTQTANYDDWLDINGDPIPWNSQGVYTEGQIITVKSYLSTNHKGHMDLMLCPDSENPTQECFEANPLEFVEDLKYGAPKDVNYPNRGYYKWGVQDFEMKYKLPMGMTGDILMQWRYVTGNSCIPPGYLSYPFPDPSWIGGDHSPCSYPLDPTGARCTGCPEQFWNCAEITIIPDNGQPTAPTVAPPTAAPVKSPVSPIAGPTSSSPSISSGVGCCTRDFKNCNVQLEGWCSESKENCEGSCMKFWLPNGAVEGCTARYEPCSSGADCCGPLSCTSGMCELQSAPVSPPTSVTSFPSKSPTVPEPCYSINYKDCLPSVASSNDQFCNKIWLSNGAQSNCIALGGDCSSNQGNCCGPTECFVGNSDAICIPPNSTSSPTKAPTALSQTPTSMPCTVCDDVGTNGMIKKGKDCSTQTNTLNKKCNKSSQWSKNKFCQLSCYNAGNGYDGDVCCNENT